MTVTHETKAGRRIVTLFADYATQEALRDWAKANGFDLGWKYNGWPQRSDYFDFHVTVVASENAVKLPVRGADIDTLELTADAFEVLGDNTPALRVAADAKLNAIREFFVSAYGIQPTYADFKPHVSLSYKWGGSPALDTLIAPTFPLRFNYIVVSEFKADPPMVGDAKPGERTEMAVTDAAAKIGGTRRTTDGYLVADVRCARTGIQDYAGYECGKPDMPLVRVYRPESEVFSRDALASYAFRPVTVGHPMEGVDASNWKKEAVGTTGGEISRDGETVRVPMVLMDAAAIEAVEGGLREISMGYACSLDWTPGTTPDGQAYDAVQRGLRMNHLAIVEQGRAGPLCRVGDAKPSTKESQMKITVDGISYEVSDQAAELVKKLQGDNVALTAKLGEAATALDAGIKARDAAIGERDAAKSQVPTAAALDAMVVERSATIDAAKALFPAVVTAGRSVGEIRADAVAHKLGDAATKDKSADYVAAAFDTLSKSAPRDPLAAALKDGGGAADAAVSPRDAYLSGLQNAWKGAA